MHHDSKVTRVIDGDTFEAQVELGFNVSIHVTVRVFGCDAWEVHGCDKEQGIEAKEYVSSLIGGNRVELTPHKQDSFGRWLCDVSYKKRDLVKILAEKGYLKN
jgi:endonuclease YncB( thermonuclease family)